MKEAHWRKLETMYLGAPINRLYQPTILIGDGTAEVGIDVVPSFFHAAGALHGSVYFKLIDDACFFAVASLVEDVFVLTTSLTTYFTRPVSGGRLTAKGRVVHAGKNLFLAEAEIENESKKGVGRGNGAFARSQIRLTSEIGYGRLDAP